MPQEGRGPLHQRIQRLLPGDHLLLPVLGEGHQILKQGVYRARALHGGLKQAEQLGVPLLGAQG